MNKLLILIIFFLVSCTSEMIKTDFDISNEMSLNEFKNKLEEYAINNPYPNIDN